ncbi:MAG: hypothetical protein IID44_20565 [Planctomycetes bacterium]|nr:hypothetical protein [Planctomycetota bacterium]
MNRDARRIPNQTAGPRRCCLKCQYPLGESGKSKCGWCGHSYDTDDPRSYSLQPVFLRWKFWFPGLCLSIVSGVLSYAVCLMAGDLGLALFVAVPISFGAILGYSVPRAGPVASVLLGACATVGVALLLVTGGLAGAFCGMTLAAVFTLPVLFGLISGVILRNILERTSWDQRSFFPIVLFALLPYAAQAIESNIPRRTEVATIRSELTIDATPQEAWQAVMFYEEVEHDPPWLLRLALPKPVRSVGNKQREGEVVRCYYDRGYLVKRISRREEGRLLAFDVIEQKLHFERDVTLLGGSFEIIPTGDGRSHIVLTTRYERHLSPAWIWQPIESEVVHTLHEHVLEGMRRHTQRRRPPAEMPERRYSPQKQPAPLLAETSP